MKKRIISIVLVLVMMASLASVASASDAAVDPIYDADVLAALGLFKGVGTDSNGNAFYDLYRAPNRHEAVTMLVRLLGKEAEAKAGEWETPFTDVEEWAKPYVGYAYAHGLTNGTSATTYSGAEEVTASQYLTFVLRALGYSSNTDFMWDKAWILSDELGITNGEYVDVTDILRAHVVMISRSALEANLKGTETALKDKLISENVFDAAGYEAAYLYRIPMAELQDVMEYIVDYAYAISNTNEYMADAARCMAVNDRSGAYLNCVLAQGEIVIAKSSLIFAKGDCGEYSNVAELKSIIVDELATIEPLVTYSITKSNCTSFLLTAAEVLTTDSLLAASGEIDNVLLSYTLNSPTE